MEISDSLDLGDNAPLSAADWIERQILSGRLPPGARVELRALGALHGYDDTEWAQVLARLSLSGLAVPAGDLALRVTPVSVSDLDDLTATRILIEGAALRAAIGIGGDAWEDGIRDAYARLSELDPLLTGGTVPERWEAANHAFHQALVAACPVRRLLHFADQLYLQHERYRRLSTSQSKSSRDVAAEHRALCEATLARDAARAESLLAEHIQRTATIAAAGIRDGSWFGSPADQPRPLR